MYRWAVVALLMLALMALRAEDALAALDPLELGQPPLKAEYTKRDRAARWFDHGELYFYGDLKPQSYAKAAELYGMAAAYGHGEALFSLGYLYAEGLGVHRDENVALALFRRATQAGSVLAAYNLAYLYDVGHSVPQDDDEALRLYRLAVEGGDADAMVNLAIMLDEGRGTLADPGGAARYLLAAFALGVEAAEEWLFDYAEDWAVNTRREVQRLLRDAGVYEGELDGQFGDGVRAALRNYRDAR